MKRQRDIYPRGTIAFHKSFSHIFRLCPLSLQLSQMIPLVKVFPGNACTNINLCMYSEWTNCSNLLEGVHFFKLFMLSTHQYKKNDNQQSPPPRQSLRIPTYDENYVRCDFAYTSMLEAEETEPL